MDGRIKSKIVRVTQIQKVVEIHDRTHPGWKWHIKDERSGNHRSLNDFFLEAITILYPPKVVATQDYRVI